MQSYGTAAHARVPHVNYALSIMKKAVMFLVPAILVAIGIALIASYKVDATAAARSDGWTQARGTIEKIAEGTERNPIDVTFRYEFSGREYRANQVTLGKLTKKDVPSRLAHYTVGRTVLIYVNPANPSEAVLELGKHPARGPLVAGSNLIYLGIAVAVVLWWRGRQRTRRRVRRPGQPMSRPKPPKPPPPPPKPKPPMRPRRPVKRT
jgi:uncharacterized protein DUF3592